MPTGERRNGSVTKSCKDLATIVNIQAFGVLTMSAHHDTHEPSDPVEAVVKHIPIIIPAAGAVLIFLLAFIAVFMA